MAPENILTFTQRTTETEAWNSLKADVATKIKKNTHLCNAYEHFNYLTISDSFTQLIRMQVTAKSMISLLASFFFSILTYEKYLM